MPRVQWTDLPVALRDHLFERARERKISAVLCVTAFRTFVSSTRHGELGASVGRVWIAGQRVHGESSDILLPSKAEVAVSGFAPKRKLDCRSHSESGSGSVRVDLAIREVVKTCRESAPRYW